MEFIQARETIKTILLSCGLTGVSNSKVQIPELLPAGIISLSTRIGDIKVMSGYANQKYKFEIHIVVDECGDSGQTSADENLIAIVENIDMALQVELFTEIDKVEFYDSLMSAKNIRVAKFEVMV